MRRISIGSRLVAMATAPLLCILLIASLMLFHIDSTLERQRLDEIRRQVDTAVSLYVSQRAEGGLSDAAPFGGVKGLRYGDGEYFFIVDGTTMLSHPKKSLIGKDLADLQDPNGVYLFREFDQQIRASGEAVVRYDWPRAGSDNAVPKLSFALKVPGETFFIGTGVYVDDLTALFYEQVLEVSMIVAPLAAILLALAFLIWRSIVQPLGALSRRMTRISEGDLDAPVDGLEQSDELGHLARALDHLRQESAKVGQLAAEKKQADAKAAERQQAIMDDLSSSFGAVVDKAAAGDFSGRVDAAQDDAALRELATGLNTVLETVEHGVAETGRVFKNVAEGKLGDRVSGVFQGSLAELQTNVNKTLDQLTEMMVGITKTSAAVSDGAGQISTGSVDLSTRAESQATSLEETVATMEEMSASIKSNAEDSDTVTQQAKRTSELAEKGGAVVGDAVSAMSAIEESSTKIADIITVIDGISFQTNLLALNAAVEAARAGEAGKGFAVVASEVRALAQRSAEAARDIKQLISTSSEQVANGVRLVENAGASLKGILEGIDQVTVSIERIAQASNEQASGVAEVSTTISHLDQMTQQNASLAEVSASNARSLAEQSQILKEQISFFDLDVAQDEAAQAA